MRHELEAIEAQVERFVLTLAARAQRIHDALEHLAGLTQALFRLSSHDGAAIDAWMQAEQFAEDAAGYFRSHKAPGTTADAISVLWDRRERDNPAARRRLFALRRIGGDLARVRERLPGVARIYWQDVTNVAVVSPAFDVPAALPPDFDWRRHHTYDAVTPAHDPTGAVRWTAPGVEQRGERLSASASIPVHENGTFVGLWSIDVPLDTIHHNCIDERLAAAHESFLVDHAGRIVAHAATGTDPATGPALRESLAALGGDLARLDLETLVRAGHGTREIIDRDGEPLFLVWRTVPGIEWVFVATIPKRSVLAAMSTRMQEAFARLSRGEAGVRLELQQAEGVDQVVRGFNSMAETLESTLRALRDSESRYRSIFDSSMVGVILWDLDGSILEANDAFLALVGFTRADLARGAINWRSLTPRELWPIDDQKLDELLANGFVRPFQKLYARKDGTRVPVLIGGALLAGSRTRGASFVLDLTEQKNLEEQFLQAQKMGSLGRMAGGIAHDFNNLLTALLGEIEQIAAQLPPESPVRAPLGAIRTVAVRAAGLTRQLLAFARKQGLESQLIACGDLVTGIRELLQRGIGEHIELVIETRGEPWLVQGDPGQLEQVVFNLVANACDAMPSGGRLEITVDTLSLRAEIDGVPAGEWVTISVRDSGTGTAPEVVPRSVSPFLAPKEHGQGIVQQHGGHIRVATVPGRGTTTRVWLPRAIPGTPRPAAAPAPVRAEPRNETVLVVEDEPVVRQIVVRVLRARGHAVLEAANGLEALAAVDRHTGPLHLLLTDLVMPKLSGVDLARRLALQRPALKVLYMTGYAQEGPTESEILRKPFTPDELVRRIDEVLAT